MGLLTHNNKLLLGLTGGGLFVSWAAWWNKLISATVEQTNPANVVLTFPTARTSLGKDDFTIPGFIISSASWEGTVLTLILLSDVGYGDSLTIIFNRSNGTHAITNNVTHPLVIEDGHTVAWYDSTDLTTITKSSDLVSRWNDKLGSGHDLKESGGKPLWNADGILFDGINDNLKTDPFTYNQPEVVYIVVRQKTWTSADRFFDGAVNIKMILGQTTASPGIALYAGVTSDVNNNLAINTWGIVRCWFDGNNAKIIVDNTTPSLGHCSTGNGGGFTLGSSSLGATFGNIEVKEILLRDKITSIDDDTAICNYLAAKYGFTNFIEGISITLTATTESENRINLTWIDNSNGALPYVIERSEDGVNFAIIGTTVCGKTSFGNAYLTPNTRYYYRIRAFNSGRYSDYSNTSDDITSVSLIGIWHCQGDVLYPTTILEQSSNFEANVIYEGDPVILTGNVFKMWYSEGWSDPDTSYAESYDGINWVKYAYNPIIVNHLRNSLIKVAGVYYLYCMSNATKAIDLYTSTDGITFVLDTANVLVVGAEGAWDHDAINNTSIIIENGVWYLFYDGKSPTGYQIGLATSNDGRTFVKHASNPLIHDINQTGAPDVHKIGNSFYMWVLGGVGDNLPSDLIYRYKSDDLVAWSMDTLDYVYQRATADEGVGTSVGQCADPFLIEVGNKVYLFYSASADGSVAGGVQHIKLAIADMPFTDLILTEEGRAI